MIEKENDFYFDRKKIKIKQRNIDKMESNNCKHCYILLNGNLQYICTCHKHIICLTCNKKYGNDMIVMYGDGNEFDKSFKTLMNSKASMSIYHTEKGGIRLEGDELHFVPEKDIEVFKKVVGSPASGEVSESKSTSVGKNGKTYHLTTGKDAYGKSTCGNISAVVCDKCCKAVGIDVEIWVVPPNPVI